MKIEQVKELVKAILENREMVKRICGYGNDDLLFYIRWIERNYEMIDIDYYFNKFDGNYTTAAEDFVGYYEYNMMNYESTSVEDYYKEMV